MLIVTMLSGALSEKRQSCTPPSQESAIAAVRELNLQYIAAARTGDAKWFERHMADDVVVVLGSGKRLTKTTFLAAMTQGLRHFKSLTVRDVTVRAFGSIAQVDADAPWEMADGVTGISRYIDTYAWMDCRWQVISAQITLLPRPS